MHCFSCFFFVCALFLLLLLCCVYTTDSAVYGQYVYNPLTLLYIYTMVYYIIAIVHFYKQ